MSTKIARGAISILFVFGAGAVSAEMCGDDVDGARVPCACGDTVVSDVTLSASDPIVQDGPCASNGLLVRAPEGASSLTVDLGNLALRGQGQGTGVWFLSGGEGGARLVSSGGRGAIVGFQSGVLADGPDTLGLMEDISVRDSGRDGVRVDSKGFSVRRTEASGSRRDGFSLDGESYSASDTRASGNGRFGYFLTGRDGVVGGSGAVTADKNTDAGFKVLGTGIELRDCVATENVTDGVNLRGAGLGIAGCRAEGNRGDGIVGTISESVLSGNAAVNNEGNGLLVRGVDLQDGGGNSGSGNRGAGDEQSAVQCEIGGATCR